MIFRNTGDEVVLSRDYWAQTGHEVEAVGDLRYLIYTAQWEPVDDEATAKRQEIADNAERAREKSAEERPQARYDARYAAWMKNHFNAESLLTTLDCRGEECSVWTIDEEMEGGELLTVDLCLDLTDPDDVAKLDDLIAGLTLARERMAAYFSG